MTENVTAAFQQQLARRRQNIFNMFTNPQDAVGDGINKSELAADIEKGEVELDEFNKAVYADTPQNRKLGRVGQEWHRKKKSGDEPAPKGGKQNGNKANEKKAVEAKQNSKILIEELRAEFGVPGVEETKQAKAYRNHIAKLAVDFFNANPNAKFTKDDIEELAQGETEKFEKLKGFKKLNAAIEKYVDSDFDDEEEKAEDNNPFEQYEDEFQKGCGDGDDDIEKEEEDVEDDEDEEETEDDEERTDAEKAEMISLIGIKRLDIWKSQIDEIAELDEDSEEYDEAVKAMDDEIADYADVAGIEKSDIMNALSDFQEDRQGNQRTASECSFT